MKQAEYPAEWDDQDVAIARLLNCLPVPESARLSAHQHLLRSVADCPVDHGLAEPSQDQKSKPLVTGPYRSTNRWRWMAVSGLAASVVFGLFWWSSSSELSTGQLLSTCSDQIDGSSAWQIYQSQADSVELFTVTDVLRRYLALPVAGDLETRPLTKSSVSPRGRVWKISMKGRSDLYLFVFESPGRVENVDQQLKIVAGLSKGWSTAAVQSNDRLLVFMSRDDLKGILRFMPLA